MKKLIMATLVSLVTTIAFGEDSASYLNNSNCPVSISKDWLVEVETHTYSLGGKVLAVSGDCKLLTIEDNFVSEGHKHQDTEKIEDIYFPRPDICKGRDGKIVCESEACVTDGRTTICWANRVHFVNGLSIKNGFVAGVNKFKNKVAVQYVNMEGELIDEPIFASPSELTLDLEQPAPSDIAWVIDEVSN